MESVLSNPAHCSGRLGTPPKQAGSRVRHLILALLAAALMGAALPAPAGAAPFEAIRSADATLARIGYRLAIANAPLCDRLEPGLGLVLHTASQYSDEVREAAVRHFHFAGPVAVEAVIAGSPAARAGIRPDDSLLGVGSASFAVAGSQGKMSTAQLVAAAASIAVQPSEGPLKVHGRRAGRPYTLVVDPIPACRTRFELAIGSGFEAQADGEMVQVGSRFLEDYGEEEVAAVVAHELSHNILRHRERLEARGVSFGVLAGWGRNADYFRRTELEADILSVSLLANAGYDPAAATRFWRDFGPKHAGGILRGRSHPAWRDRIATIERAIAALGPARPARSPLLASRDGPLDGDWRALLVKAR
jgi:Zn-dependent protease with chaperone function